MEDIGAKISTPKNTEVAKRQHGEVGENPTKCGVANRFEKRIYLKFH